ncbi:uncharacterized protein LOC128880181 [Hylaeus volcanicus]|uniref:uncharacterized protein LOC128880181 n=1 Tax=Hylaeus volcanicus TaxID=313075 RepID=UPI0023B7B76E|nr:uncharacterized protein LOC128880181 [Hylaeus volcanicus]
MSKYVLHDKELRYEKLAKPKERIDRTSNWNAFNVKPAALSYQITDSLNKLAQPRRKPNKNVSIASSSSTKSTPATTAKQQHKLINSNEQSKDAQESKKKKFLLDTYARIVAARNKRCSKRLNELAKPKNYLARAEAHEEFDNYFQTIKSYNPKLSRSQRSDNL